MPCLADADADPTGCPPAASAPAVSLGRRYHSLAWIGEGGMGVVYRAFDRLTGNAVALKRVRVGAAPVVTLAGEFAVLATLRHPGVVRVLDYGFDAARRPFFTMELLHGARPLLPVAEAMTIEARLALVAELLRALSYLHRRGILHRDLKPSNVVVGDDGRLRVLDFGLAAGVDEARAAAAVGTLPYMAPELLVGAGASVASDVYSAAVLAYGVLAGRHPFPRRALARTPRELLRAAEDEPVLTRLPPAQRAAIGRALSRSPAARQRSAAAFLAELAIAPPDAPSPALESHLVAARFTGRQGELGALRDALHAASVGRGSMWLVGGESGVGKSRLLDELRTLGIAEGALEASGQATPAASMPYQAWRPVAALLALETDVELSDLEAGVLATVVPNLEALLDREVAAPPPLDAHLAGFRLLGVLRDQVSRVRGPVVILLEDLHWADAETLALLERLAADLASLPVLLVGTYRDDEAPRLITRVPGARHLRLSRFDRSGVEALCRSMLGPAGGEPGLVDLVTQETEGNAFFVVEVLRALAEESGGLDEVGRRALPARVLAGGVEETLARRLGRAPARSTALLELCAVHGRDVDLDLLAPLIASIDDAIEGALEAGVLEAHAGGYRFSHDKLRERIALRLDPAQKRALHARLAARLETLGAERAADAARHHHEAGDLRSAASLLVVAGEIALGRGAFGEAAVILERARALHDEAGAARLDRVRVFRALAQARFASGQLVETGAAIEQAFAAAGSALPGDGLGAKRALAGRALELFARSLGLASVLGLDPRDEGDRALREQLLLALSTQEVYAWLARPERLALSTLTGLCLEESLASRGAPPLPLGRTSFRSAAAVLLSYTPLRGLAGPVLERAGVLHGTASEIDHARSRALIRLNEGRFGEAAEAASEGIAKARAQRDDVSLMHCLFQLQVALSEVSDFRRVVVVARELHAVAERTSNPRYRALAQLGRGGAWLRLGELSLADVELTRAFTTLSRELGPLPAAIAIALGAVCALRAGDRDLALARAESAMRAIDEARFPMGELAYALTSIVEVMLEWPEERTGEPVSRAAALLARLGRRFPVVMPVAAIFAGRVALWRGDLRAAARELHRGLRAAQRAGSDFEEARARLWLGRLALRPRGARLVGQAPEPLLRAALATFERQEAAFEARQARASLLELGAQLPGS